MINSQISNGDLTPSDRQEMWSLTDMFLKTKVLKRVPCLPWLLENTNTGSRYKNGLLHTDNWVITILSHPGPLLFRLFSLARNMSDMLKAPCTLGFIWILVMCFILSKQLLDSRTATPCISLVPIILMSFSFLNAKPKHSHSFILRWLLETALGSRQPWEKRTSDA